MNAEKLLDSRKLNMILEDLAATWSKKRSDPKDREVRFQALLEYLEPMFSQGDPIPAKLTTPIADLGGVSAKFAALKQAMESDYIPPQKPEEQIGEFDRVINQTIERIRTACNYAQPGQTFKVGFPVDGEFDLRDLGGLCQIAQLPCGLASDGMASIETDEGPLKGMMVYEFVKG